MSARLSRNPLSSNGAGGNPGLMSDNRGQARRSGNDLAPPPPVDQELIDYLNRVFPARYSKEFDLRDYDIHLGALTVIKLLQSIHDQQNSK